MINIPIILIINRDVYTIIKINQAPKEVKLTRRTGDDLEDQDHLAANLPV